MQHSAFLERLRSETAPIHQKLESLPLSQSIIDPQLTLASYAAYLSKMYPLFDRLEEQHSLVLTPVVSDIQQRRKAHLIASDLHKIGFDQLLSEQPETYDTRSISTPSNPQASAAYALGAFYVLEGSSLGGRLILKNVEQALDIGPMSGAAFFNGYGAQTGSQWKSFLAALTDYETQYQAGDEIIKGAVDTFHFFYNTLNSCV